MLIWLAMEQCLHAGDLTQADGLKRLAVFSNSAPTQITMDDMMLLAANTTTSQIRLRAEMTPRTFDIADNQFSGAFPGWLVDALAGCIEDVTVILDVSVCALVATLCPQCNLGRLLLSVDMISLQQLPDGLLRQVCWR